MRPLQLVCASIIVVGALGALIPNGDSEGRDVAKRNILEPLHALSCNNTTSASLTDSSPPTHSQPPPPPTNASCESSCHCATGDKTVPMDGRYLCGWCAAVSTEPGHFLNVTDVVLCKDSGCCNYGISDGRCEKALDENPPDFETWCPWPVQELDPPSSTSTGWSMATTPPGTPIVTVPFPTSTCASDELNCTLPCPTDEPNCKGMTSNTGLLFPTSWITRSKRTLKKAVSTDHDGSLK